MGLQHSADLGPFFIDRSRVEVVDFHVGVRPDGMGQRSVVFGKLMGLQHAHGADPLNCRFPHIAAEFLVSENGETFLETQLEPIATGYPVAGPIMEILMGNDGFDSGIFIVGSRIGPGENELVIENVEALILHCAHIEIADRDNDENVQVIFEPEAFFIPTHGAL